MRNLKKGKKGDLKEGKYADFIILPQDPDQGHAERDPQHGSSADRCRRPHRLSKK